MEYREIEGDLIALAKAGEFDVIAHGCNCMCTMKRGLAPLMAEAFLCNTYGLEGSQYKGDINKLGRIDYRESDNGLIVVNCYTQYMWATPDNSQPLDYSALELCLKKINHVFKGKHIGLPKIGCGLAGGNWFIVQGMIKMLLKDCKVTIVMDKNQTK